MKATNIQRFIRGTFAATLVGLITFVSMPAEAAHEVIYAVDRTDNSLINFYSDAPQSILSSYAITGLQLGERIQGIDYWNGTIYGLGSSSRLYTIDPNTGGATQIGSGFSPVLNGPTFGVDNGPAGFQVVSGSGQNLLVSRTTGNVISSGPYLNPGTPGVDALAYDGASGMWYAADSLGNTFGTLNPATGTFTPIGLLGIDMAPNNGMDISPTTDITYMGTPAAESDPQADLWTVDKNTGLVALVGQIGNPGDNILVQGLTVVPTNASVPDGGTTALLLGAALSALGLVRSHRGHTLVRC